MKYNALVKEKKRTSNNDSITTREERKIVENNNNKETITTSSTEHLQICISPAIYIKFHFKSEWSIYKNENNNKCL